MVHANMLCECSRPTVMNAIRFFLLLQNKRLSEREAKLAESFARKFNDVIMKLIAIFLRGIDCVSLLRLVLRVKLVPLVNPAFIDIFSRFCFW